MSNTKKKEVPWRSSKTKDLLQANIHNRLIEAETNPRDAFFERPEYAKTSWKQFPQRLRAAKKYVTAEEDRASADKALFLQHKQLPKSPAIGKEWNKSQAQKFLREDIDSKKNDQMTPKELYNTRKEYQDFSLEVFRKHIYSEVERRKFLGQYKRN